jgi:tryptophanase
MSGRGIRTTAQGTRQLDGDSQSQMERQIAKLSADYRQYSKDHLQEVIQTTKAAQRCSCCATISCVSYEQAWCQLMTVLQIYTIV